MVLKVLHVCRRQDALVINASAKFKPDCREKEPGFLRMYRPRSGTASLHMAGQPPASQMSNSAKFVILWTPAIIPSQTLKILRVRRQDSSSTQVIPTVQRGQTGPEC